MSWKILSFLIVLPSVIIFNLDFSSDTTGGFELKGGAVRTTVSEDEPSVDSWRRYIVRFRGYKKADEHKVYLQKNLRSDGWRWIDRKNPSSAFPTDFALVSIDDQLVPGLIDDLEKLGFVKDVFVESRYSRGLLVEKEDVGAKEMKRPGKIFTSMSFDDGSYGNSTFTWNRKLMIQVLARRCSANQRKLGYYCFFVWLCLTFVVEMFFSINPTFSKRVVIEIFVYPPPGKNQVIILGANAYTLH